MSAHLFSPLALGPITLPNRIVIAPMCQYSAADGDASDWHLQHLMTLAMSGAGLVIVEATAVERPGRITHGCLGLYSDSNEKKLGDVLAAAKAVALPGTKFGIQLAHAGRKASTRVPWQGGGPLQADQQPWSTFAPSSLAFDTGWSVPEALDEAGLVRIRDAFAQAARRAVRIGFDEVEIHLAHGYLLHEFQSPLSNRRFDRWGGDAAGRMAFPLSVARAVREAVPGSIALGARITGSDWHPEGLAIADAIALARALQAEGMHFACVSSGGNAPGLKIPAEPGYQVPFAKQVRQETGLKTRAVGLIAEPHHADSIVRNGEADMVAMARAFLDDPRWGWHAAESLGVDLPYPPQYARVKGNLWPRAKLLQPQSAA